MKEFLVGVFVILFPCIVSLLISIGGMFIHLDGTYLNPLEWKQVSREVLVFFQAIWLIVIIGSFAGMH